jgi:hypothetical protein
LTKIVPAFRYEPRPAISSWVIRGPDFSSRFSKQNPADQELLNWSAVRGSNTDFNTNSRVNQGGCGFASDKFDAGGPAACFVKGNTTTVNPAVYDHGITRAARRNRIVKSPAKSIGRRQN